MIDAAQNVPDPGVEIVDEGAQARGSEHGEGGRRGGAAENSRLHGGACGKSQQAAVRGIDTLHDRVANRQLPHLGRALRLERQPGITAIDTIIDCESLER